MKPDQWTRVRALFEACNGKPPAEVDRILADEPEPWVVNQVRALLLDPESNFLVPITEPLPPVDLTDYELGAELGRGGMGIVRRAKHRASGRDVAIKLLQISPEMNPSLAQALRQEASRTFGLRHPHIVRVLHVGEEATGPFVVMELIEGSSLRQILVDERTRRTTGSSSRPHPILRSPRDVAHTLRQLADALQYSHERRLVHRDVKPSNVLVDSDGVARLTDFGVAKDLEAESVTQFPIGTLHYMSPEQARARQQPVDARTDIFSLAVVGYEMLTLVRPFEGDSQLAVLDAIQRAIPVPIRRLNGAVPPPLERILSKAMRKDANLRYGSAQAFADDLRRFIDGEEPLARPPSVVEQAQSFASRHRTWMQAAVFLLLVSATAAAAVWLHQPEEATAKVRVAGTDARTELTATRVAPDTLIPSDEVIRLTWTGDELPLPVGWWSLRLVGPDGAVAEHVIEATTSAPCVIPMATAGIGNDGMVHISGGPMEAEDGASFVVPPFLLDKTEVTNDAYRTFLRTLNDDERAQRRPSIWPAGDAWWTATIGTLPVVAISWFDACAYAAWAGKRLPTCAEWQWAATRGTNRRYVWGPERGDAPSRCNVAPSPRFHPSRTLPDANAETIRDAEWQQYLAFAKPVGSFPDDNVEGVVDLQGNAREWTANPLIPPGGAPNGAQRVVLGGCYRSTIDPLNSRGFPPCVGESLGTGFRCAKSVPAD